MSIVIRDVREHELDSVLALNNNAGLAILPLDAAKLRRFYETAEYFRVAERDGNMAGFLVGYGSNSAHDSCNFAWFQQRYPSFFYIDRIVVASRRRGGGVGRAFYQTAAQVSIQALVAKRDVPVVTGVYYASMNLGGAIGTR